MSLLAKNVHLDTRGARLTIVLQDQAYRAYERYARQHRATKADPLRTFSGWLGENNIKIEESKGTSI